MKIYLASQSLRRQELLQQIDIEFELLPGDIDETAQPDETPIQLVNRLAREKSLAGWQHPLRKQLWPVLAADTLVVKNGEILGKPSNEQHAIQTLQRLSDTTHQVITGVSCFFNQKFYQTQSISEVTFCHITDQEIIEYWHTSEPIDKAGSYAIQGKAAKFVTHINGSYSGIVGLPLHETWQLLNSLTFT